MLMKAPGRLPIAEQEQMLAGLQIIDNQGADRLAADQNGVALFQMLQPRRERAVLRLDAEEFGFFFLVGAGDAVGPRFSGYLQLQADHDRVAVVEPRPHVTSRGEGKQGVVQSGCTLSTRSVLKATMSDLIVLGLTLFYQICSGHVVVYGTSLPY